MAAAREDRKYDLIVVGATGYTGTLTALHIAEYLPTNLRWAIAGRSQAKLEALAMKVKAVDMDRIQPAIEVVSLEDKDQAAKLVGEAKICLSVVSYVSAGEIVLEACVESGTDYVDTIGDIYLVDRLVRRYHEKAVAAGIILIHALGMFSAPQDLLSLLTAQELTDKTSLKAREVILAATPSGAEPSGGTINSIMHAYTQDSQTLNDAAEPWVLSPIPGTTSITTADPATSLLGLRHDPDLGVLASTSHSATQDRAFVHRTWGLLATAAKEGPYAPSFRYSEYELAPSALAGLAMKLQATATSLALSIGPLRQLVRRLFPAPGDGPDIAKERVKKVELQAVAVAEEEDGNDGYNKARAYGRFTFKGGPYVLTAALLAQGAASILYKRKLEGGQEAGMLTPAFLGWDLVDRIRAVGGTFETKLL